MRQTVRNVAFALILGLVSPLASAQTPPPAPAAADAAFAAQKAAFLALPEATRKAAQEALVWLGLYVGVNDGEFGKRTRDAILAFQGNRQSANRRSAVAARVHRLARRRSEGARRGGVPSRERPKSGAKIGAPLKLISARGGARLDFASSADADLGALYARLSAATPARKITYKAIKPDTFFVVSGQDGATMFYTRFDKNPAATPPVRGFTFAYPASQGAYLNRVAIAVANSFEPFPGSAPAPARERRRLSCAGRGGASGRSRAGRDRARHRARQGADRAQARTTARTRPSPASRCGSSAPTPQRASRCWPAISVRTPSRRGSARQLRTSSSLDSMDRALRQARPH